MRLLSICLVACTAATAAPEPGPFAAAALKAHVEKLAAPALDGRAFGSDGDRAARTYLVERLEAYGLTPVEQAFTYEGKTTANVYAIRRGSDARLADEIVVVGAHHDHLGDGHLGANDNASGVAGVLAIAEALGKGDAPRRSVAIVLFGAEEAGLVGSQYFVAHPPAALPLANIVEYINLDMIGSHASKRAVYAFGAFGKLPTSKLLGTLARRYPKLNVGIGGHSVRGDQLGFCKAGIPYVFFWTPDHSCYHAPCDTVARLDLPRLADIASLANDLVRELANGSTDLAAAKARHGCKPR